FRARAGATRPPNPKHQRATGGATARRSAVTPAPRLALDAGDGVTRHVMVGFFDPADGNQAETAAVSETTTTAGRAAATTAGPFGARVAMDAGGGVGRALPYGTAISICTRSSRPRPF